MNRKQLGVAALFATILQTVVIVPLSTQQGGGSYDPWVDYDDNGVIDIYDLQALASTYGASGTPINKTALLLDLLSRVEALETKVAALNATVVYLNGTVIYLNNTKGLGAPDYDSGWRSITQGSYISLTHNLNTNELLVYFIGKYWSGYDWMTQYCYGGDSKYLIGEHGAWWAATSTTINLYRAASDHQSNYPWEYVRVLIWKIAEP